MTAPSRRTAGLAGLVMGPVCLGLVALSTWLQRDYLHSLGWTFEDHGEVPYPSATATGDWAALTVGSFLLAAALAAVLAAGLRPELRGRFARPVATAALGAYVVAFVLLAFPTDVRTETPVTWHGWLHGIGFFLLLLSMLVAYTATGLALRRNDDWCRWWVAVGGWPVLLLLAMFTGFGLPGDTGWYAFLVTAYGWPALVGLRLLLLHRERAAAPRRASRPAAAEVL